MVDLAVTRIIPGTNIINMTVLIGYRLMGVAGATTALVGLIAAPFGIVLAAVYFYDKLSGHVLDATMEGAAAGALGLLILTTYKSIRHALAGWQTVLVIAGVFVGIIVFKAPFVPLISAALAVSLLLSIWQRSRSAG